MTDNFVGFARSPKQSKTAQLQKLECDFTLQIPLAQAVQLISTAEGAGSWIAELVTPLAKWRFQLGAKLRFNDETGEFGATFGAINLPTEVILLTERFGEIRLSFVAGKSPRRLFSKANTANSGERLAVSVTRMCEPADTQTWEAAATALVGRLGRLVSPRQEVTYSNE